MLPDLPALPMVAADQADLLRYRRLRSRSERLAGADDPAALAPYLLRGEIHPGQVFFWEPDLPHAREIVVVSRIEVRPGREVVVLTRPLDGDDEVRNDMSRFREAAVRTIFRDQPTHRVVVTATRID